jgi:hypothetical protein
MSTKRKERFFGRTALLSIAAAAFLGATVPPSHAQSDVFSAFNASGPLVSGAHIIELVVPPGRYAILAKINVDNDRTCPDLPDPAAFCSSYFVTVACTLLAGTVPDRNVVRLQPSATVGDDPVHQFDNAAIHLQLAREFPSNNTIVLRCTFEFPDGGTGPVSFRFARITAIRVDGTLCKKKSPAICVELHD